jgi:molybdopterin-guanine dinucleotide biosynthesis protein A
LCGRGAQRLRRAAARLNRRLRRRREYRIPSVFFMSRRNDLTIGILVGGHSRRMGTAKALLRVGRRTMLERTTRIARRVSDRVCFLGQPVFELPESVRGIRVLSDLAIDAGPIGGLAALLAHAQTPVLILLACDMPKIVPALPHRVADAVHGAVHAAAPRTGDERRDRHPCCAAYAASALPFVQRAIANGRFAMQDLLDELGAVSVPVSASHAEWLTNVNSAADWRGAGSSREI